MKRITSISVMVVLLLLFSVQPAAEVSGNEPNDTMGTADPVVLYEVYKGVISSASDVDWYAFTPDETAIVQFSLSSPANKNYNVDVYDETGVQIASRARDANKTDVVQLQVRTDRTYYFKVYGASGEYDAAKEYGFRLHRVGYGMTTRYEYDARGNLTSRVTSASEFSEVEPGMYEEFDGQQQVVLNNVDVNLAAGGKNTVEFWMYWDGTALSMPFSWTSGYNLFLFQGSFGFNTYAADVYGFSSELLQQRWVFVSAVFVNGVPNSNVAMYVNGRKQVLSQREGSTTIGRYATGTAYLSGAEGLDQAYNFRGKLGGLRIWNRELTEAEIQNHMHRVILGDEPGLVAHWMTEE